MDNQLLSKARLGDVPLKKIPAWFSARPLQPLKDARVLKRMYLNRFVQVRGGSPAAFIHIWMALSATWYYSQLGEMKGKSSAE